MRPLMGLTGHNLLRELLAGVTLLAIAVPLNIGYAQIAGLPATAGLYALIVPAAIYALVVSSRQLVASPDAAAAALVASSIGGLAAAGSADYLTMALAQAIICGALFLITAVFRLGFLANFLSKPILVGFVGGLALDILVSQIAKMLGVKINSGGEFVEKVGDLFGNIGSLNWWSVLISVVAVVVLMVGARIAKVVPWALIVLVLATIVVVTTGLEHAGVSVLGKVDAGPPHFTWPILSWTQWLNLFPSAIALLFVTMAEGLLVARSYGEKRGYSTNPNQDLFAFGLANVAAGATGGFTVGSSTSRTAAMDSSGSRTQLPSLVAAVGTLLLVIFGTALLADIPSPAIGAIVGVAVLPLLGIRDFVTMWKQDRFEFIIGAVCFLVTLFVGAIAGIAVSFVLALVNLASRASRPAIDVLEADDNPDHSLLDSAPSGHETAPGVIVIRLAAPLFFANSTVFADAVKRAVRASSTPPVHDVVIDLESVTDVDVTAAETMDALKTWLTDHDITLGYSRARLPLVKRMREIGIVDDEKFYDTNREALVALAATRTDV
ncbi:SulP family inorganic anion transporter [Rathayibacter sp. CAU 1779]